MKVISVLGRKGGSGKTLVSHYLSLGTGRLGFNTVMLQTDVRTNRPLEYIQDRPYWLISIHGDPSKDIHIMQDAYVRTERIPNSVLLVDGGANRRSVDLFVAETSSIVLIPVGISAEDVSVAISDYKEISDHLKKKGLGTEIYFIRNRWPGDARKTELLMRRKWIEDFLAEHEHEMFPYIVPDMPSLLDITYGEPPYPISPLVTKKAMESALLLTRKLGLEIPNTEDGQQQVA